MKLRDYKESLDKLIEEHPECLDFDVLAAADDEGNDFCAVTYIASLMFKDDEDIANADEEHPANVVCLN